MKHVRTLHISTGMNMYAALMLVPISVVTYTVIGGLKATFTSSYLHTVIIFVTLNLFVFKVTNEKMIHLIDCLQHIFRMIQ